MPDTIYHDPITLEALLREEAHEDDDPESHEVEGRDVVLRLGESSTAQSCTAETTPNGIAACTIDSVEQLPGEVPVTATFVGDDYYTSSTDVGSVTVLRRATALTVESLGFAPDDGSAELTGTLVEDGGAPIAGRALELSLGTDADAQTCTASPTDADGEASCEVTVVGQPLGPRDFSATFAGDDYYLASAGAGELIVFAWTSGGNVVIGDGNASTGSTATYWSSEWYLENYVSGGNGDESFKGFANSPSPSACGAQWQSFGGRSAFPPDDVPEYTAVLVTDWAQKLGQSTHGSTSAIAIVRVDPGYQPYTGKTGTATVLGLFCQG